MLRAKLDEPIRILPDRQTSDSYIAAIRAQLVPRLLAPDLPAFANLAHWAADIGVRLLRFHSPADIRFGLEGSPTTILLRGQQDQTTHQLAAPGDDAPTLILLPESAVRASLEFARSYAEAAQRQTVGLVLIADTPLEESALPERHIFGRVPAGAGERQLIEVLRRAFNHLMLRVWVSWLDADLDQQAEDMADMQAIGLALSAERNLDTLLHLILTKAREITHADSSTIWLVEERPEGRFLRSKAAQNYSIDLEHREFAVPVDPRSIAGWVALTGDSLCLEDVYALPEDGEPSSAGSRTFDASIGYRTKSMLAVPVKNRAGETCGVIQLMNRKKRWTAILSTPDLVEHHVIPFSTDRVAIMESLAGQAGVALANAKAARDLQRETRRSQILLDVMRAFSDNLELDGLLRTIMHKTVEVMDADRCTLFLIDAKTDELWARAGEGIGSNEIRFPRHLGLAGHVATTGETVNIREAYEDPRFNREVDRATGYRTHTILCLPVRDDTGRVLGAIQVLNKRQGIFTGDDERLLAAICSQAAVALKNAQLFEDVLNMKNYNESILRSIATGVLTLDSAGRVTGANPAARRILELDDQALGLPYDRLFDERRNPVSVRTVGEALATMQEQRAYEVRAVRPSGESISLNLHAVPLKDRRDEPVGLVVVVQDITREQRLMSNLSRYVSREVAEQLLKQDEHSLGGTTREVAVLFSDIRSYTTLTERISAEAIVELLNDYFSRTVPKVLAYKGMLDKYIGDAIMAVYGAPLSHPFVADYAVWSAIEMRRALRLHNVERVLAGHPPIDAGIGLCMGEATYGNIGSEERMDLTVIGDTVNVSSRLEELTKRHEHKILVTDNVLRAMRGGGIPWVELGPEYVKGKTRSVELFGIPDAFIFGPLELPPVVEVGYRTLPDISAPPSELAPRLKELLGE